MAIFARERDSAKREVRRPWGVAIQSPLATLASGGIHALRLS